jgi:hypothetical protein
MDQRHQQVVLDPHAKAPRIITVNCPACRVQTLDVKVGRKDTVRLATCPLCRRRYDYSAWVVRDANGVRVEQVDTIERVSKR